MEEEPTYQVPATTIRTPLSGPSFYLEKFFCIVTIERLLNVTKQNPEQSQLEMEF